MELKIELARGVERGSSRVFNISIIFIYIYMYIYGNSQSNNVKKITEYRKCYYRFKCENHEWSPFFFI